jgi:hypothetical protein
MAITLGREEVAEDFVDTLSRFISKTGTFNCYITKVESTGELFIEPVSYQEGDAWVKIDIDGSVEIGTPAA